ncbi:hypothetical protein [Parabacteroides goldsteinii]|uniref:hypothetical protein n=1 Tax=Parabacteroides goldsteinii TaxID=328812 RepID=UPI003AB78626
MTKAIDFKNVPVEIRIGEAEPTDVRRSVGNAINRNTSDIGLADFARKIFYAEAPVEIPAEYVREITGIVTRDEYLLAPAKVAVLGLIREAMAVTPAVPAEDKTNV